MARAYEAGGGPAQVTPARGRALTPAPDTSSRAGPRARRAIGAGPRSRCRATGCAARSPGPAGRAPAVGWPPPLRPPYHAALGPLGVLATTQDILFGGVRSPRRARWWRPGCAGADLPGGTRTGPLPTGEERARPRNA
ncbi:hypothetical protein SGL43_01705 [Streptomyces globisporus]|uniref:Uncharacterized protein n=1 Tax=Streptomyces globisporus TaxID=1908 RepID=A0ABM9GT92_STRGL|nr:hypothetical protein SGL43_01705 [Streptomyces globisporus]